MKKVVFFSIIFLSLMSYVKKNEIPLLNNLNNTDTADVSMTYLALGDSYTIGESVAASERYPVQTVNLLRLQNVKINNPDIIAVTGWTTGDLIQALNVNPPKTNYSVVSLLIGVNNQYRGQSLGGYKTEFTELLKRAVLYAGSNKNHVFVLSVPDYSVTPFASGSDTKMIAKDIDAFNEANKKISLRIGVHYLDITTISRGAENNHTLLAADGLHPSGLQYEKWSKLLAPLILHSFH